MSILNEKSIRKRVVKPQLEAVFGDKAEKADAVQLTDYLIHQDPREPQKTVTGVIQQLRTRFGEDPRNQGLAIEIVASMYGDDD